MIDELTILAQSTNSFSIVYEDIRPYTSRFNMDTINTCKMIGRLEYVLAQRRIDFTAITRNEVKSFVFKEYPGIAIPDIEKKILLRKKVKKDGEPCKPAFQFVDDRIVQRAMVEHWGIKKPKPGKTNSLGIKTHAWQALGALTCYLKKLESAASGTF
jgi:hypothetical protein